MTESVPQINLKTLEPFNYIFAAIRGIQAGREYYLTMCPLRLIPKIFLFDNEEVPPQLRAQRILNRSRIPRIAAYVHDNTDNYVFSSITASIDGKVKFYPIGNDIAKTKIGFLVVPMTARFLINDGQHRQAAIEAVLKDRPELGDETISVVFFVDAGLKRSQQMFADLNKHAVRPTRSLSILYDHRDPFARAILRLVDSVPLFKGLTDLEKTTISNRSLKLFTLSSIYQATEALLGGKRKNKPISDQLENLAAEYWTEVAKNIPEWTLLIQRKVSSSELRKEYVHSHGVTLQALGNLGRDLIAQYPDNWKEHLKDLAKIDWLRSNAEWEGRTMIGGRLSKAHINLVLTTNLLKQKLGLSLTVDEEKIEERFQKGETRR